jgi:2-methylcitrate dehydratase PrpD
VGQAYGDDSLNPQAMMKGMGREYEIMRTSFKLYPCCRHIHPLLDALGEMRQTREISAGDVKSAKLSLYTRGAINVGDHALRTHNARYAIAMALEHRVLQRDYFSESFDIEPMLPLMERIELYGDPELDRDWPGNAPGIITLQMRDGSEHTNRVDYAKGTPENPIVPRELLDKFNSITAAFVAPGSRAAIANLILQSSFDVTNMMGLLTEEQ